jgi:hypothetical protein
MAETKQSLKLKFFSDFPLGLLIKTKNIQKPHHTTNHNFDKIKRDPEALLKLSKTDIQELKKGFGRYSSIGELENQLYMIIQIEHIQIPLDRQGFA